MDHAQVLKRQPPSLKDTGAREGAAPLGAGERPSAGSGGEQLEGEVSQFAFGGAGEGGGGIPTCRDGFSLLEPNRQLLGSKTSVGRGKALEGVCSFPRTSESEEAA